MEARTQSSRLTPRIADASLACLTALKSCVLASSRDNGWSSLLLDHVEGRGEADLHETRVTPDLTIVAATRGEHEVDVLRHGRWTSAIYGVGTLGLTPGGETTRLRWRNRRTSTAFWTAHLYLPHSLLQETAEHYRRAGQRVGDRPVSSLVLADPAISATVLALISAMKAGAPDLYAEQAARWLASHLLWAHAGPGDFADDRHPGQITDARLARVIEHMTANYRQPLGLADLAAEAGISSFHFSRLFRRATGRSPHAFLTDVRLQAARRLLATTTLPVGEVALECGYARASTFTSAFTARFGAAPRAFRSGSNGDRDVKNPALNLSDAAAPRP